MTKQIVFAAALALTSQACISEDGAETEESVSALGIPGGGSSGNHFYYAAYSWAPYIYKGCPEPQPGDPQPWREKATLLAKPGTKLIELELGTAIALDVRARSLPPGVAFKPTSRGATLTIADPTRNAPITLSVSHLRCRYDVNVEVVYQ